MKSLDEIIFQAALKEANRLIKIGFNPEDAAATACRGSWSEHRGRVLAALLADVS